MAVLEIFMELLSLLDISQILLLFQNSEKKAIIPFHKKQDRFSD